MENQGHASQKQQKGKLWGEFAPLGSFKQSIDRQRKQQCMW
jgi:hypothetical protein